MICFIFSFLFSIYSFINRCPTSGSFVRYNAKKISTGQTFLEALEKKYADKTFTNEYDASKDNGLLYFGGNKNIVVETVGFEKVERKQRYDKIRLR